METSESQTTARVSVRLLCSTYGRLPEQFYAHVLPTPVCAPQWIAFNAKLSRDLGLGIELLSEAEQLALFAGNAIPEGVRPLAMAYAGHQFGNWVPQLGDGRAILLGEVRDVSGVCHDIQWKGGGRTPYSRGGDGRAALGPVMREYLVSEAMHALGVPTTRALAAVLTGERVLRDKMLPGAVLVRVAASHVRVGTFQYFAAKQDIEGLKTLADYVIERHYPFAAQTTNPYLTLLSQIVERQAALIARWMSLGFIHGVMNTDNMTISGETIDYGPCAFMDHYDPDKVFSSIDSMGRYAFSHQPKAAQWNLARLAEALLPLIHPSEATAVELATTVVADFMSQYDNQWLSGMRSKLGLVTGQAGDGELVQALLDIMHGQNVDYTLAFRSLANSTSDETTLEPLRALFSAPAAIDAWVQQWRYRLTMDPMTPTARCALMRQANPQVIPRNHQIAAAITAAEADLNFEPFNALHEALARPYEERLDRAAYTRPPTESERVRRTFCGT
jgi:uncharacterized protein YdiU (UPF0061 family)